MLSLILYLDSSVIGGLYDAEFQDATRALWRERDEGTFAFRTSALVAQEIASAPDEVQALLASSFAKTDLLPLTPEAEELAGAYLNHKVVPIRFANDARHVAIACMHGIGLIVSWSFQDLVNYQREMAFNGVNLLQGYAPVRFLSPLQLIHADKI